MTGHTRRRSAILVTAAAVALGAGILIAVAARGGTGCEASAVRSVFTLDGTTCAGAAASTPSETAATTLDATAPLSSPSAGASPSRTPGASASPSRPGPSRSAGVPTVAADGTGRYPTVQAAVDAVPAGNSRRVTITIKPGTYRETVTVPANKPYVTLQGLGSSRSKVLIVDDHYAGEKGTSGSATVFIQGHDFAARNLTFSNDYDEDSADGDQALALHLNADRVVLDNVALLGDQDTLLVNEAARAYIVDSYIEGTVDFIFGGGVAVFDNCTIHEKRSVGGPITAASTPANRDYGFLIYRSRITGDNSGRTQLGRPWRANAQVLYRESHFSATLATAQPWTDMHENRWKNARLLEYRNTGPGATVNGNRPQLSEAQAGNYTPQKYLAGADGWNPL